MRLSKIASGGHRFSRWSYRLGAASLLLLGCLGPAQAHPRSPKKVQKVAAARPAPTPAVQTVETPVGQDVLVQQRGIASWYGRHWQGRRTASGAPFNDQALTAAHLWLPFATEARVTNLANGKSVEVVVNDRGPYHAGRIIDLSARAAQLIGMAKSGVAPVLIQAVLTPKAKLVTQVAMQFP